MGRGSVFPIILSIIFIVIIIYFFANVNQPYVVCSKTKTNDLGFTITEEIKTTLDGNSIEKMDITKTITFPENYISDHNLEFTNMRKTLKHAYDYLPKGTKKITQEADRLIAHITIEDDETIILDNMDVVSDNGLNLKINANTKAEDVVTLKIKDKYTEGEFMTHMKKNGYTCN